MSLFSLTFRNIYIILIINHIIARSNAAKESTRCNLRPGFAGCADPPPPPPAVALQSTFAQAFVIVFLFSTRCSISSSSSLVFHRFPVFSAIFMIFFVSHIVSLVFIQCFSLIVIIVMPFYQLHDFRVCKKIHHVSSVFILFHCCSSYSIMLVPFDSLLFVFIMFHHLSSSFIMFVNFHDFHHASAFSACWYLSICSMLS